MAVIKYRPEIDGLRAFAVLGVIFYHAKIPLFSGGFAGVDIFFVISGYLLTSIILHEHNNGEFSFRNFYERRARRILPALFFVILTIVPIAFALLTAPDLKQFAQSVFATTALSSNFLMWHQTNYFAPTAEWKLLEHTWSLSVEEQFYLLFPIVLIYSQHINKKKQAFIFFTLLFLSALFCYICLGLDKTANFYFLPSRIWEFLFGSAMALPSTKMFFQELPEKISFKLSFLGLGLILLSFTLLNGDMPYPSYWTLVPVLGAVLLIGLKSSDNFVGRVLSFRPIVFIGLISYSLYLWHYPVFVLARYFFLRDLQNLDYLYLIGLTFFLSIFSYNYIEMRFRNKIEVPTNKLMSIILFLALLFIAFGLYGHFSNGFFSRYGGKYSEIFSVQMAGIIDAPGCHGRRPEDLCRIGDDNEPVTWALVGDSHAAALGSALDHELKKRHLGGVQLTQGGCPYVIGLLKKESKSEECNILNERIRKILLEKNIKNIVISGRYVRFYHKNGFDNLEGNAEDDREDAYFYSENLDLPELKRKEAVLNAYKNSISELINLQKQIYLIYPVPEVGFSVPRQTFKNLVRGFRTSLSTSYSAFLERSLPVILLFDNIRGGENLARIKPSELFCNIENHGRCETQINKNLLYFDDDHVSNFGASLIVNKIFN